MRILRDALQEFADRQNLLCRNKHRFVSEHEAQGKIEELRSLGLDRPEEGEFNAYVCHRCGRYHIGHAWKDRMCRARHFRHDVTGIAASHMQIGE
jgi:hypothetical protein